MHIGLTADSVADLLGHVSDLVNWIRQEVVWFQEVKCAERQQLKGDAHMAVVVKPVEHLHAVTDEEEKQRVKHKAHETGNSVSITDSLFVVRILLTDLLQDVDFQFGCFSVFVLVLNDLQCNLISSSVFKHCFKKKKYPPHPRTHCTLIQLETSDEKPTCCGPHTEPLSQRSPHLKCRLSHLQDR